MSNPSDIASTSLTQELLALKSQMRGSVAQEQKGEQETQEAAKQGKPQPPEQQKSYVIINVTNTSQERMHESEGYFLLRNGNEVIFNDLQRLFSSQQGKDTQYTLFPGIIYEEQVVNQCIQMPVGKYGGFLMYKIDVKVSIPNEIRDILNKGDHELEADEDDAVQCFLVHLF